MGLLEDITPDGPQRAPRRAGILLAQGAQGMFVPEQLKGSQTALLVLAIVGLAVLLLVPLAWLAVMMFAGPAMMDGMPGRMGGPGMMDGGMMMGGWAIFWSLVLLGLAAVLLVVLVRTLRQQ